MILMLEETSFKEQAFYARKQGYIKPSECRKYLNKIEGINFAPKSDRIGAVLRSCSWCKVKEFGYYPFYHKQTIERICNHPLQYKKEIDELLRAYNGVPQVPMHQRMTFKDYLKLPFEDEDKYNGDAIARQPKKQEHPIDEPKFGEDDEYYLNMVDRNSLSWSDDNYQQELLDKYQFESKKIIKLTESQLQRLSNFLKNNNHGTT